MKNYMLITACYTEQLESGKFRKVSPKFLLRADGFTEAETGITGYLEPYVKGGFVVKGIQRESVEEIIDGGSDNWFKFGVDLLHINEDNEKVKREPLVFYVSADTAAVAQNLLTSQSLDKFVTDWEVVSVVKSKVIEVIDRLTGELPQGTRFEEAGNQ